jgi:hypothetical protein
MRQPAIHPNLLIECRNQSLNLLILKHPSFFQECSVRVQ